MKTVHIRTYGCQMNVYDSARMADLLAPLGYRSVEDPDDADLVILNTCHIREKAAEKVYSELGRLRAGRRNRSPQRGPAMLAVAGCVAQAHGEEIFARAPFVDIVVGPQAYHRLPELIERASRAGGRALDTDFPEETKFDALPEAAATDTPGTAFVTVQEGCDKFCSFCVVPYTRGAEESRPVAAILDEVRRFADLGAREITLLGQNVNAYHGCAPSGGTFGLAALIGEIARIPRIERIRYTTSHPSDMSADLIEAHRNETKLMPFLHLPVQSGSDRVLRAMNRRYTADNYRVLVDRLRAARPDLALATDLIVGFPGETDADFDATLRLVEDVGFAHAYSFRYSPRPGTPAATAPDPVPEAVKAERLRALEGLLEAQQRRFNAAAVGSRLPVLFDRPGRRPGQLAGRSPYMQAVHADGPTAWLGSIRPVSITAAGAHSLTGDVVAEGAA